MSERLIDAEALKKSMVDMLEEDFGFTGLIREEVIKLIDNAPTIMTEEQVDLNEVKAIAEEAEQERPHGDLISRSALKKEVENLVAGGAEGLKDYYENGSKSDENSWIGGVYDAWELIGDAPTVCDEDPAIPTFNRKELEKARDYWYNHLEVGNEEQNEAAWAAINAIKYCIEHSSGYQRGNEKGEEE
jgi:hypothetical protein